MIWGLLALFLTALYLSTNFLGVGGWYQPYYRSKPVVNRFVPDPVDKYEVPLPLTEFHQPEVKKK